MIFGAINYYPLCPSPGKHPPSSRGVVKVHAMNYSASSRARGWGAPADSRTKSVINHISTPRSSLPCCSLHRLVPLFIVSCFKSSWNTVMNQFGNGLAWLVNAIISGGYTFLEEKKKEEKRKVIKKMRTRRWRFFDSSSRRNNSF